MQALRLVGKQLEVVDVPRPSGTDMALVRVEYAGICATDMAIVEGGYTDHAGTLGHEFVGIVESAPEPDWIGRRVVADINIGCGRCTACKAGHRRHCVERAVVGIRGWDGAFAECVAVPPSNLYAVPDTVSALDAVFAEPLAAAARLLEQVNLSPAATIGVLGDGKLGQLIAQVLQAHQRSVTLIGRHARKLDIAAQFGIAVGFADELKSATRLFDVVVEATGRADGLAAALRLVRPCGTVVLKSTFHGTWPLPPAAVVVPEVTIVGSRCGDMARALALLAAGVVRPARLIEAVYDLRDGPLAFQHARTPGTLKVLLRMAGTSGNRVG